MTTTSEPWEWGEAKKRMLNHLAQSANRANTAAFQHLKVFTANLIENKAHPKTTDVGLYVLRETWDIFMEAFSQQEPGSLGKNFADKDIANKKSVEIYAKFLIDTIPWMGVKELHHLIAELTSDKPLTKIIPGLRVRFLPKPPE